MEISHIDGQPIEQFLKQYFEANPNELADKVEPNETDAKYFFNVAEWRAKFGDFKTGIELLYRKLLNEIDAKRNDDDFENFLLQQYAPILLIDQFERQKPLFPDLKSDLEFAISTMKALKTQIDTEISRLEREKAKGSPTGGRTKKSGENRVLAYNNGGNDEENVIDAMEKIEMILNKINDLLFVGSTPTQWKQLLKGEVLEKPIVIKDTIVMEDFKHFIDCARKEPVQIFGSGLYTAFEDNKAFLWNEHLLKRTNISNCHKRNEEKKEAAGTITKIDEILSTLI